MIGVILVCRSLERNCRGGPPWPPLLQDLTHKRCGGPPLQLIHHCHLKILNATMKLATHHASSIAMGIQLDESVAPSFIKARSTLLSAVSGSAWMNGWRIWGKRSDEKNVPDSNHIGSMMKFIKPDTPSIVVGRAATSNPIPEKVKPPSTVIKATLNHDPRTVKPNTSDAKIITAATSSTRNIRRESMNESR